MPCKIEFINQKIFTRPDTEDPDTTTKHQRVPSELRRLATAVHVSVFSKIGVHQPGVVAVPIDRDGQAEQVVLGIGHVEAGVQNAWMLAGLLLHSGAGAPMPPCNGDVHDEHSSAG